MEKFIVKTLIIIGVLGVVFATVYRFIPGPIVIGILRTNSSSALIFSNSLILIALGLNQLTK